MLLKGKNAVIYGAGGAIGGAVARTFAGEGARVFLAGRTRASLDAVADADLPIDDFTVPIAAYMRTHLLTARAAARHMLEAGSGVILMMTTTPDRLAIPFVGPFGVMCAAVEALSRTLAAELGPHGIRVVCLRSTGSPEAPGVQWAFTRHAEAAGKTRDEFQKTMEDRTMLRRLTTLAEVADMAAFMASDRASATTAAAANLTCGLVVD